MNMHVKKVLTSCILSTLVGTSIVACDSSSNSSGNSGGVTGAVTTQEPVTTVEANELGISAIPSDLAATFTSQLQFNRYTKVDTPNGGKIHIVAQDGIKDNQIVRARNILEHFLKDHPESEYGADKSAVANKMAENGATLMLLNGIDDGTNQASELPAQPLYYGEMQVEGGAWYVNQNYEHRDASYEEILHLVHDFGIGVDQNSAFIGALPEFQAEIRAAQTTALSSNLWGSAQQYSDWIQELTAENSLSQEYLAAVVDSYYGLWGAFNEGAGMWGIYVAKTRDDILLHDVQGAQLMNNKFFHPYLTYNARIDESFTGSFSLRFDQELPYSHHAQYLKDITLTGDNDSNVIVNGFDNNITGNIGTNIVVFSGNSSQYQYQRQGDKVIVIDLQNGRDGNNTLAQIEYIEFTDTKIAISDIE